MLRQKACNMMMAANSSSLPLLVLCYAERHASGCCERVAKEAVQVWAIRLRAASAFDPLETNAGMVEHSMDKLPELINSLLAPLESDSIDDEEVQEKLMKSVLDVTHIFRTAASEKLLRFEDPTQHRSPEADSGKKRKRVDKRDVIRAQFAKEQYKSFVSIMMEWLTLPSSAYVEVQVVALNALLDMVKRFEADNIFDNSLFARTMRALITSSNCSAELVVTFLQNYAKKYGDIAYFALKGMRVVVMDTVASYEDKKTSKVKLQLWHGMFTM